MKSSRVLFIAMLSFMILAGSATAHVQLNYPVGGETFIAGETIEIRWDIVIPHPEHTSWDLFYSSDGGENWEIIQTDLPKSQLTFEWTAPQNVTELAKIRVYQDGAGYDYISGNFSIQEIITSVQAQNEYQKTFDLYSNFPNPFNPTTTIGFSLPEAEFATLIVYDITGRKISEIMSGEMMQGVHSVVWDGADDAGNKVSSGLYFYRLQAGEFTKTQSMTLVR